MGNQGLLAGCQPCRREAGAAAAAAAAAQGAGARLRLPASQAAFCGRACGRALGVEEAGVAGCDPAGVVFDDTLRHLGELDQRSLRFASGGNLAAMRWLFLHGAKLEVCDSNGTTLLHAACRTGSVHVVKDLVRRGLAVDVVDAAGWTPLHAASCMGRQDVSLYLLQAGASATCRNKWGQVPEDLCSSSFTKEVVVTFDSGSRLRPAPPPLEALERLGRGITRMSSGLHFEPFFVPRDPVLLAEDAAFPELEQLAVDIFRASPGHGIAFLVACGVVADYPANINGFLMKHSVDPALFGEYLGEEFPISKTLRLEFLNSLQFLGTGVASALQVTFRDVALPSDWRKLDRLTRGIAHFWWQQHSDELDARRLEGSLGDPPREATAASSSSTSAHAFEELAGTALQLALVGVEGLHQLMFSSLMLYQWLRAGHHLTLNEWVQLNTGIESGSDVPLQVQAGIYRALREGHLAVCEAVRSPQRPGLPPTLEGWARVSYRGRAAVSHEGESPAWVAQTPRALADQGGVTSAGRSPTPKLLGLAIEVDEPTDDEEAFRSQRSVHKAQRGAAKCDADLENASRLEDRAWLRTRGSLLLLASTPDFPPYAFAQLQTAELLEADGATGRLVLVSGARLRRRTAKPPPPPEEEIPSAGTAATSASGWCGGSCWFELCLLLGDGRFQPLEAPRLELILETGSAFDAWENHARSQCFCTDEV